MITLFNILEEKISIPNFLFLTDSPLFIVASLKSKSPYFLLNKNRNFGKIRRNQKQKILHKLLEKWWTLWFSLLKNLESKVKLWWVRARERKKIECMKLFFRKFFDYLRFFSIYSVKLRKGVPACPIFKAPIPWPSFFPF